MRTRLQPMRYQIQTYALRHDFAASNSKWKMTCPLDFIVLRSGKTQSYVWSKPVYERSWSPLPAWYHRCALKQNHLCRASKYARSSNHLLTHTFNKCMHCDDANDVQPIFSIYTQSLLRSERQNWMLHIARDSPESGNKKMNEGKQIRSSHCSWIRGFNLRGSNFKPVNSDMIS